MRSPSFEPFKPGAFSPDPEFLPKLGGMSETIFSRIIRGEIPCHRIYEDDKVLAFLDVSPLSPGHTLIVPKEAVATLDLLSDESSAAIGRVLPRIARAVMAATGATDFNVLQNNGASAHQLVLHVHFHIIPKLEGRGLGVGWTPMKTESADLAALGARIAAAVA
jgi:histidine triad (HIT) family protein